MQKHIFAEAWQPAWFALVAPSGREARAVEWLNSIGVDEAWYPTEIKYRRNRFKNNRTEPFIVPSISGYVFAMLERRPIWPWFFTDSRRLLLDVVRYAGKPAAMSDGEMSEMRMLPERLAELRRLEIEAKTIRPGDTVAINGMDGWSVTVEAVENGVARIHAPGFGGRLVVDVARLVK